MAKPEFNRFDYIECFLPTQTVQFKEHCFKVLEKDDVSLLQIDRPHINYYNSSSNVESKCLYDILYNPDKGYDQTSSRCDRQSERKAKKTLHEEENKRIIGIRTSSTYGKRKYDIEGTPLGTHNRVNKCKEFLRPNKINTKPDEGLLIKNDTPY